MPQLTRAGSVWLLISAATIGGCGMEATPDANPLPSSGGTGGGSSSASGSAGVAGTQVLGAAGTAPSAGSGSGGTASASGGTFAAAGGEATAGAGNAGTGNAGAGVGGNGTGGGLTSGPTAGCGKQIMDEPGKDVLHDLMVKGIARRYWTKIPTSYSPATPLPLVFYGPGCGASGVEGAPLDNSIKDSAIRVFVIGTGGCFDTGGPEPETGYFNAVLDDVQASYCTDKGKVFVSGYSSGAWLSMLLACTAGDRITAIGTAAGGFRANHPECKGNPAAMFHAGTGDTANPITKLDNGVNEGSSAARDRMVTANGCTTETKVWDPAFPYCRQYVGCTTPVVWCEQNVGHSNGEEVARTGWWKFWSALD